MKCFLLLASLLQHGMFPLDSFVVIDPDRIRYLLPEMHGYLARDPENAGCRTQKEVGLIAPSLELIQVGLLAELIQRAA